jgi:hypothetical protein
VLKRVDRVQIVVSERAGAERIAADVFGAQVVRRDKVVPLRAKRTTMQAGTSLIELLEADGAGPVGDFIGRWGGGLFAAGFSVDDVDAAARHFDKLEVHHERAAGQLFLDPAATFGMRTVISAHHERAPVGAIRWIYEVTNVVGDWRAAAERYARLFALDSSKFSPLTSIEFGYTGTLTLFNPPERLDRIEIAEITKPELAMGRFHQKRGDSLYMFFAETDDVAALAERLPARGDRRRVWRTDEAGASETFIHPSQFLGVLVGVSRTGHAWTWSGDPERARRAARERAVRT